MQMSNGRVYWHGIRLSMLLAGAYVADEAGFIRVGSFPRLAAIIILVGGVIEALRGSIP
jgi:hypothetical protein